mmetsp:Transcript_7764/g.14828  ORF Transcript_7764/g.14828 Transcript_7764/m.14828 type:complete len:843 (+) Transcript_7764:91-2619(+)
MLNDLKTLLQEKKIPCRVEKKHPNKFPPDIMHNFNFTIPGTQFESYKYSIIFTPIANRCVVEFYNPEAKCWANLLSKTAELVNEVNSSTDLRFCIDLDQCQLSAFADIWVDEEWSSLRKQSVIWNTLRHFNAQYKAHFSQFGRLLKSYAIPYFYSGDTNKRMTKPEHISKSLNVLHQNAKREFVETPAHYEINLCFVYSTTVDPSILDQSEELTQSRASTLDTQPDDDLAQKPMKTGYTKSYRYVYRIVIDREKCKVEWRISSRMVTADIEEVMLTLEDEDPSLSIKKIMCRISSSLKTSKMLLHTGANLNTFVFELKSVCYYTLQGGIDDKALTYYYEQTLNEYKQVVAELDKIYTRSFNAKVYFIGLDEGVDGILESDNEESEGSDEENETHFKCYENTPQINEEREILMRLARAKLLTNFGLESLDISNSFTSLTFHSPSLNPKLIALDKIVPKDDGLITMLEELVNLLIALSDVQLEFKDLVSAKLFVDDEAKDQRKKIFVYYQDFLFNTLQSTSKRLSNSDLSQKIQDYLRSNIKTSERQLSEATMPGPDEAQTLESYAADCTARVNVALTTEEQTLKLQAKSIDGVKNATIYSKSIRGLTVADVKLLFDRLYRCYQLHRHPFLLHCYGYNFQYSEQRIFFAFEYCPISLLAFVEGGLTFPDKLKFFKEVASVLGYLSSKAPMKLHISPKQILLSSKFSPKLMPFYYKDPKDFFFFTPYNSPYVPLEVSTWGRSLTYSFALIYLFVSNGGIYYRPEVMSCIDGKSFADALKGGEIPNFYSCDSNEVALLSYCIDEPNPNFYTVISLLDCLALAEAPMQISPCSPSTSKASSQVSSPN